jgi:tetratricopeptide (TPR) repeat protein
VRRNRIIGVGFLAGAAGLLVAAPVVLAAAKVKDWRLLTAAAVVAAIAALFAGVWKARLENAVQTRETLAQELSKGTFTPGGRLPRVRDIIDPITIGVHPASRREIFGSADANQERLGGDRVPVYVPRDLDIRLRGELASSGFVLLVGDSTAGKTRAAFEAVRAVLPDHVLVVPESREGVAVAVKKAAGIRRCVLWLNDLEGYLGTGGLTRKHITELLAGDDHHRVIVATLRAAEEDRLTSGGEGEEGRQLQCDSQAVLDQAHWILVERRFSPVEQQRAEELAEEDPRIADALTHADTFGIAEYLACGPQLLNEWESAWAKGTHPRAAAVIAAAIDVRRAGYTAPLPKELLSGLHIGYLDQRGGARLHPESEEEAWEWAIRPRPFGNAPLHVDGDTCEVFDYLLDVVQRRTPAGEHVPEVTITTALRYADATEAANLGDTAQHEGRYRLAETALRQALTAQQDQHGADHPATLVTRKNLANVLGYMGRLQEAEAEHQAVLKARKRVFGADHLQTMGSRNDRALVLHGLGRLQEAEAEHRAAYEVGKRMLGADHPYTLASRSNRALVLRHLGRLEEAETEQRAVLETMVRTLSADHPNTLTSRNSLALVFHDLGRLEEAEAEHRAVLEARKRVLGADHPHTLTSRNNLATVLRDLGRLEEAEAEHRAVLEARSRVLGADHPDTLTSRNNLAIVSRALGRQEQG